MRVDKAKLKALAEAANMKRATFGVGIHHREAFRSATRPDVILKLLAEIEEMHKDSDRYRFFRDSRQVFENGDGWGVTYLDNGAGGFGGGVMQADFTNLDEAIDFAMSKKKRRG